MQGGSYITEDCDSTSRLHTVTSWRTIAPGPIVLAIPALYSIQCKPFITGIGGSGAWGEP